MKKIVLIAEDDKALRDALKSKLESENEFFVETAEDGKKCLTILEKTNVDLVVLDVMMPEMDGMDVARKLTQLKEQGKENLPKILMLTNDNDSEKVLELMGMGILHYLVKANYSLEDIVGKIREMLITR